MYRRLRLAVGGASLTVVGGFAALLILPASRTPNPLSPPAHTDSRATSSDDPAAGRSLLRRLPTEPHQPPGTPRMAASRRVTLYVPGKDITFIGYHEATTDAGLALEPFGLCARNYNTYKFDKPVRTEGPRYVIMSSRGRLNSATSAVDVVMPLEATALSPVTGSVANIKRYRLYGSHLDYRISIIPVGSLELRVVIIHVDRLRVQRGSEVVAGVTPLGTAREFPFRSQVNDYVGPGSPHIHIEVKVFGT